MENPSEAKTEKPKFFSRFLSSASNAARSLQTAAARALVVPKTPAQQGTPPPQIAVVAPAPAPPETPTKDPAPPQPTLKRFDSKTLSPTKSRNDPDTAKCPESVFGQHLVARYQESWARMHETTAGNAAAAADAHTNIAASASYNKSIHRRMNVLRSELAQLPDMMAALARTVQAVDGIRASLAACEDALGALAEARVQQSLAAIKAREDKRLQTYSRIRRAEADNAVRHLQAAHAHKQRELARQASLEAAERQRAYDSLFAQQMQHYKLHRRLLTDGASADSTVPDTLDTLPDMSDADLAAFLDDTNDVPAEEEQQGSDDDDSVPAVVVRRDEEDIDDSVAQKLATVS